MILAFLNLVLRFGIPSIGGKAIIIPILRPEKQSDKLKSYRPVALTSIAILCKKMVIVTHLWKNKIIYLAQCASQPYKSAIDQVTFLYQWIQDNFNTDLKYSSCICRLYMI